MNYKCFQLKGWRRAALLATFLLVLAVVVPAMVLAQNPSKKPPAGEGDPEVLELMEQMNQHLAEMGLNLAVEQIELFTIGEGRPTNRIHQKDFRWVADDPRRLAQGDDITYIVDPSWGSDTTSGVPRQDAEDAIDRAMTTWDSEKCLKKVDVVKRAYPGEDVTIFDFLLDTGGLGDPFLGDIVHAGFFASGPPLFGPITLAFSVTFIFTTGDVPTDINGDNRLDTALNEVYYNDGFDWQIDGEASGTIDIETVALHESGHSLGIGHFGPPPTALMNPVYGGLQQSPRPVDHGGMCSVWASWPK